MNYIVFDLEWNQSPEGKERSDRYLQFEIVEIGAVKLDQNRKPIGSFAAWSSHRFMRSFILRYRK